MNPIWLANYPAGIPATIDADVFPSLNAMFNWAFEEYKDLPACSNMDQVLTFAQLDQQSNAFAAFLQNKLGITKGDKFAIMMPNVLQYPIAMLGILRAGATVVNLNILNNPDELEFQIRDSQSSGIVVLENFAQVAEKIIKRTQVEHVIIAKISDVFTQPKALLVDFHLKYIKQKVPKWHIESYYHFKDVIREGTSLQFNKISVNNGDIAFLQYTGGTTGHPKGAMLTHRNIIANIMQISTWFNGLVLPGKEIVTSVLPIFHNGGTLNVLLFLYLGGLNLLITNPFDTKLLIKDVKKHKFTVISGVNRLYNALLNDPEFADLDFSALKICITSGMVLQKSIALRWKLITKMTLTEGYGITEASLAVSCNPFSLKMVNGTVGLPLPSTELSVRNDRGDDLGVNHPGELWIRGPQIMLGYWCKEAETEKVLTSDGWFKTGDIGYIDENGFVQLIDRKKDIIHILGLQVYPSEVEFVIDNMPEIKESAVVDAYDEVDGEFIKAFVVAKDPSLTQEQILSYCVLHLPYYKIPKIVEFRKDLPKNSVGKILRRALRSDN
jgi:long-chain acyl-CoA synthetase